MENTHNGGSGETPGPTVIVWMGEGREESVYVQRWNLLILSKFDKTFFCFLYTYTNVYLVMSFLSNSYIKRLSQSLNYTNF